MILNFDELNPNFGDTPVNDGTFWRSKPRWLFSQVTDTSTTAAASTSVVSTTQASGSNIIRAGNLNVVGRVMEITFAGYATTASSSPGTFAWVIYLGTNIIATSAAFTFATSQTTIGFLGSVLIGVKASNVAGGTGALDTFGTVQMGALCATTLIPVVNGTTAGTIAPGTQVAIDQTLPYQLDVQAKLSAATNTVVVTNVMFRGHF